MGQVAIAAGSAVAGGAAGFFLTGGNPMGAITGASLGWSVGMAVGGAIFGAKAAAADGWGPSIGDGAISSAVIGAGIPVVFGQYEIAGNVIWKGQITMNGRPLGSNSGGQAPSSDDDGSGKGGGGGFRRDEGDPIFRCSWAIALCDGPIDSIKRISADGKIVYAKEFANGGAVHPAFENAITIYKGTETQLPDPTIEAAEGVGDVPAFRGTAYVVFRNVDLTAFGNRIPNITAEVLSTSTAAYDVNNIAIGAAPETDDHLISKLGPFIYGMAGDRIYKLDTTSGEVILSRDLATAIEAANRGDGSGLTIGSAGAVTISGKLIVNELDDFLFISCVQGTDGFLVSINPTTLLPGLTSWANRTDGEGVGYAFDGIAASTGTGIQIITLDEDGTKIRKFSLGGSAIYQSWERPGPEVPSGNAIPGGMCYVPTGGGFFYAVWGYSEESSLLYLTRIRADGWITHYEIDSGGDAWGASSTQLGVAFDNLETALLVGGGDGGYVLKFSLTSAAAISTAPDDVVAAKSYAPTRALFASQRRIAGRRLTVKTTTHIYVLNTQDLSTVESYLLASWGSPTMNGAALDRSRQSVWVADPGGSRLREMMLDRIGPNTVTLSSVINAILNRAGLTSSQYYSDTLTDEIKGYCIARQMSARDALEPLRRAFLLDCIETDLAEVSATAFGLRFKKLDPSVVATIEEEDLGARMESEEPPDSLIESITQEEEIPRRVIVKYIDSDRHYEGATQQFQRMSGNISTRSVVTIEVPIVLDDDTAKQIAEKHLYQAWVERKAVELSLGVRWAHLDVGDSITVTKGSNSYTVRIISSEDGGNLIRHLRAMVVNATILTSSGWNPITPHRPTVQLRPVAPSIIELIDTAILRILDDDPGVYAAAAPIGGGTYGGTTLFKSIDGLSYGPSLHITRPATMGVVESPLPSSDVTHTVLDYESTLRVRLHYGTLASITLEELLNGGNLAFVGNEVIQFQIATLVSTGVYDLSVIARARFGTEWAIEDRAIGERFVLIEPATLRRLPTTLTEINATRTIRVASARQRIEASRRVDYTNTGRGLKPYSPCHLLYEWDGLDLHLTWFRRSRGAPELVDYVDIPLHEESEAYEVSIVDSEGTELRTIEKGEPAELSGVNLAIDAGTSKLTRASGDFTAEDWFLGQWITLAGFINAGNNHHWKITAITATELTLTGRSTLVTEASASGRTIAARHQGAKYTQAQIEADNGGLPGTIYLSVYQMSDRIGRGFPEEAEILVPGF